MNDGIGVRSRVNWNPVTDSGGDAPPRQPSDESSFSFNLGNALAKLGLDPDDATPPPAPGSTPSSAPAPTPRVGPAAGPAPTPPPTVLPARSVPPPPPPAAAPVPARSTPIDAPQLQRRERAVEPNRDHGGTRSAAEPQLDVRRPLGSIDESLPRRTASPPAEPSLTALHIAQAPTDQPPTADRPSPHRPAAPPEPSRPATIDPDEVSDVGPRPYVSPRRSVFDDVVAPTSSLPPTVVAPAARHTVVVPSANARPSTAAPDRPAGVATLPMIVRSTAAPAVAPAPVLPAHGSGAGALLPTLPAAVPVHMPPIAEPIEAGPSAAEVRAVRSAQLKASRQQRNGKVVGRTFLVLVLLGALIAGALMFGRSVVFPVEWDASLTPLVDEIQEARGAEFQHTVGLVLQPREEFELTASRLTVGDAWVTRVPEWRALGLVTGDPTLNGVAADISGDRLAVYDPAADRIYLASDADAVTAAPDLRLALEQAYDAQLGDSQVVPPAPTALAGVSAPAVIAERAVDVYLASRGASAGRATAPASDPAAGTPLAANLPLPIEYELLATQAFGEAVLVAAGADPATATFATDVSEAAATVFDDAPTLAEPAPVQVGERAISEAVALGVDDWSLAWGARLPATTVDQLIDIVVADSFQTLDRGGRTCVAGVFESATAEASAVVLGAMMTWVAGAPVESQATALSLSPTRVQLVSCDPGAEAAVSSSTTAVTALINRQLVRLAG